MALALLAVVALHLALLNLLDVPRRAAFQRPQPARLSVRLLAPAPAERTDRATAPSTRTRTEERVATPRAPTLAARAPAPIHPPSFAAPLPDSAPNSAEAAAAAGPPGPPASQPPLDLVLPRGYALSPGSRNPALADPNANTARPSPGERMAATLGSDRRMVEEDLGAGRRRFRQGAECVIVTESRIGQLLPFNEGATRSPRLATGC